jgi:peptidyl-prolyl cis-trans isomerase D
VNRVSSFLGMFAIIAIAVVFVVSFGPGGGRNQIQAGPECASEVHGKCIKASHFWATYRLVAGGLDSNQAEALQLKKRLVEGLEERELLLADAKRLGVSISEEELTRELVAGRVRFSLPSTMDQSVVAALRIDPTGTRLIGPQFLDKKTQKFSAEAYKKTVTELTRLSETDYREFQRAELVAARMRSLIMARVRISEGEAQDDFNAEKSTAKVKYLRLRPAFYRDRAIDQSEAVVAAWAEKNGGEIDKALEERKKELGGECRDVSHIMVVLERNARPEAKAAARAKIEAAKKRVEKEDFAAVAREVSEDASTRNDGGRLRCITKSEMAGDLQPLGDALFALKEGGTSEVLESPRGFHLMRLDKIAQGPDAEKALRARTGRELYIASEAKRLVAEGAKEIQAAVKAGKPFEEALATHLAKYPAKATPTKPAGDAPKGDEPKDEKKDEPKKDDPKKDDPKKDDPKKDDPKKDDPKKDEPAPSADDVLLPKIETSLSFAPTEEPFEDAQQGESPAAVAFALQKPGDVADKLIGLRDSGLAIIVLVEKAAPADDVWQKARDQYLAERRSKKQVDSLGMYLKRLRTQSQAEIKPNPEFLPKPVTSGSNAPPAPNPFGAPEPE